MFQRRATAYSACIIRTSLSLPAAATLSDKPLKGNRSCAPCATTLVLCTVVLVLLIDLEAGFPNPYGLPSLSMSALAFAFESMNFSFAT